MNNSTVKKVNFTIKLRGDNVYDLYLDGNWIASYGSCDSTLKDVSSLVKDSFNTNIRTSEL